MSWQARIYRILIASPGDLDEERKSIPELINRWNAVNSKKYGIHLQHVMWEIDSFPEVKKEGDPQKVLNEQIIKNCDILLGIFWTRLGTPTGRAESGTVEEIDRFLKLKKPVMLYFSSRDISPGDIDVDQLTRLRKYKKEIRQLGIVSEYETIVDLHEKLFKDLTLRIQSMITPEEKYKEETIKEYDVEELRHLSVLRTELIPFVRKFEADWVSERDSEPEDVEDAREIIKEVRPRIYELMKEHLEDSTHTALLTVMKKTRRKLDTILSTKKEKYKIDKSDSIFNYPIIKTPHYLYGLRDDDQYEVKEVNVYDGEEFWEMGNKILDLLKETLTIIDKTLVQDT